MEQIQTPKHVFMSFEFYSAIVALLGKMPCEAAGQVWAGLNQGQVKNITEYKPELLATIATEDEKEAV